jgi:hypothetical protein
MTVSLEDEVLRDAQGVIGALWVHNKHSQGMQKHLQRIRGDCMVAGHAYQDADLA